MTSALLVAAGFKHVTERDGTTPWNDCTWAAGLEWFRICFDRSVPATVAEMHALRAASGEPTTGGSNIGNLRDGISARYHQATPAPVEGFANLKAALQPGRAATVQGSMKAFGPTHRLSKWDPNFDSGHATLVVNDGGTLYWCDPEAPAGAAVPVTISWSELQAFVNAFSGQHLVADVKTPAPAPKEPDMLPIIRPLIGYTASIKPQSNIRVEPVIASAKVRTVGTKAETVSGLVGYVKGDVDPGNGKTDWLGWLENGQWRFTAIDNVVSTTAPAAGSVYTKATQDAAVAAAVAPLNTQIKALLNQVAGLQPRAALGDAITAIIKQITG